MLSFDEEKLKKQISDFLKANKTIVLDHIKQVEFFLSKDQIQTLSQFKEKNSIRH